MNSVALFWGFVLGVILTCFVGAVSAEFHLDVGIGFHDVDHDAPWINEREVNPLGEIRLSYEFEDKSWYMPSEIVFEHVSSIPNTHDSGLNAIFVTKRLF